MDNHRSLHRPNETAWGLSALDARRRQIEQIQAASATERSHWIARNHYFYNKVSELVRFIIEPGKRVLNIRCQNGILLDTAQPSRGLGIELTDALVGQARETFPHLEFRTGIPEELTLDETFDYILFDNCSDTVDVVQALQRLRHCCEPHTRLVIYTYNHLWEPIVKLAERIGLKMPLAEQNWLSEFDLRNMLGLAGFSHLRTYREFLVPKYIPIVAEIGNEFFAKLPGIRRLCLVNMLVARPQFPAIDPSSVSVSVVIPCKDERGNIQPAVERMPEMGARTELLFCDDKSTDGTAEEVRRLQRLYPDKDIKLIPGPGLGKAQNVWTGFDAASGDILMILDADLTVMPEELPYFFQVLVSRVGEFANGTRLVYPMQEQAMKYFNMAGNKFFSMVFSFILGQRIRDTLCGTKVLWRADWKRLRQNLGTWGIEDKWGDYELLFGAAKLQLEIMEVPVHYQERVYGTTKMVRVLANGLRMLRIAIAGFLKLRWR
ncbi:MAG: glycosyltransferase [Bdellovibrionales bacterium]|nr:glycosyltransferase [Bdellovibrionales bacterium]